MISIVKILLETRVLILSLTKNFKTKTKIFCYNAQLFVSLCYHRQFKSLYSTFFG